MKESVGLLEVFGLTAAFCAIDAACKAADVRVEAVDNNKPLNADKLPVPVIILVKLRGSLADVKSAVEAGIEAANKVSGVVTSYVIPGPEERTEGLIKINCLKKS